MFTTSSDIRECFDRAMIEQKLDYMHANPVSGEWALVADALDYPHPQPTLGCAKPGARVFPECRMLSGLWPFHALPNFRPWPSSLLWKCLTPSRWM